MGFFKFFAAVLVLGGIEAFVTWLDIPKYLLPLPSSILEVLVQDSGLLFSQTIVTLQEWATGLFVSLILAFFIAIMSFYSLIARAILHPLLVLSQSVPYLAFAPLLLLWLGLGMTPKIVLVVLTCTFPVALALEDGLTRGRHEFDIIVRMLKLGRLKAFRHVYLPYSLPHVFSGLKITTSYAFVSAVLAELIGSESGLGVYIARAQSSYRTDRMLAAIVIIVAISLLTTGGVDRIGRKVIFWSNSKK